ncbi:helix-turn-helix transcriptional regulator [Candidatus Fermentibacteria bacterium]|nr:helix-turn-helix transcriptional regulator [Candidatus Fermentibacteria bacterium]
MGREDYGSFIKRMEETPEYHAEIAAIGFTESLCALMAERGVSRAELARRLGTSQAYVTKILRGDANFTLTTMIRLVRALGADLNVSVSPRSATSDRRLRYDDAQRDRATPVTMVHERDGQ